MPNVQVSVEIRGVASAVSTGQSRSVSDWPGGRRLSPPGRPCPVNPRVNFAIACPSIAPDISYTVGLPECLRLALSRRLRLADREVRAAEARPLRGDEGVDGPRRGDRPRKVDGDGQVALTVDEIREDALEAIDGGGVQVAAHRHDHRAEGTSDDKSRVRCAHLFLAGTSLGPDDDGARVGSSGYC